MTSAPLDGVEHRQLKDSVYLKLRQEIVSARLPPGYLLREAELAARFGVSKTPLREAFVRLEKDGFVEIAPYRSAVVAGYSRQDLREIYEVRELLEGLCAREAALNIATELAVRQHIKIVTTGGVARPQSYELTGPLATGVLEQVTLDVAILGVDGIDSAAGATARRLQERAPNIALTVQHLPPSETVRALEASAIDFAVALPTPTGPPLAL